MGAAFDSPGWGAVDDRLRQRQAHLDASTVLVETETALDQHEVSLERCRGAFLDEARAGIERGVPRHVGVRSQRHAVVTATSGFAFGCLHERPAVSASAVLRRHGELLQVGDAAGFEHVDEADDRFRLVGDDEQKSRFRRARSAGRGSFPAIRSKEVYEELIGHVLDTLYIFKVLLLSGANRADHPAILPGRLRS